MPERINDLTVGGIRKAIAGLPDSTPIQPVWAAGPPGDHDPAVGIDFFHVANGEDGDYLGVGVSLHYLDDEDDYDEDEDDEDEDEDDYENDQDGNP